MSSAYIINFGRGRERNIENNKRREPRIEIWGTPERT